MRLTKYKVMNFRSIHDSGWIECDNVTTLVGVNESGKSNLLLGLWKLNPVTGGKIDPLHDFPVSQLTELREKKTTTPFVIAEFVVDGDSAAKISEVVPCKCKKDSIVQVTRFYDGHYAIEFLDDKPGKIKTTKNTDIKESESFDDLVTKAIVNEMPKFIYYSNYGNLSSKIYLPNAIKWIKGQSIQGIEMSEDQVRTLKVLFEYVNLDPEEILKLGTDPRVTLAETRSYGSSIQPSKEALQKAEEDKEKRSILLQSAGKKLTREFRHWWKQGEYVFRFEADGDYFQIKVSDDKRTDEVSLELRSTGLQWFLSFYLIFLVESQKSHKNAILLLDEAGLTLHPLAQKDLVGFFNDLSKNNPIINTTHSPFIVDTDNIDRCRVVYVDKDGYTIVSSNLRENEDPKNSKSIYALHAALGLTVSSVLLEGCRSVIVEGPTDQIYLNGIKTFLIKVGKLAPKEEIVFIPAGGVKGINSIVSLLDAKQSLPYVLVDSDSSGNRKAEELKSGLYQENAEHIILIKDITDINNCEIEDIIPEKMIDKGINKMFIRADDTFVDSYNPEKPIVNQIEQYAKSHGIELERTWKVSLAKAFKQKVVGCTLEDIDNKYLEMWEKLFNKFNA